MHNSPDDPDEVENPDPDAQPPVGWPKLGHLWLGASGELLIASRIALFGFQVYRPLADDRGVDAVVDVGDGQHAMIQVKSAHPGKYVYMKKSTFPLKPWINLGLVVFDQNHESWPSLFLIPAEEWLNPFPPLVEYEYEGKLSKPEYGLNIRANWRQELAAWSATEAHIKAVLGAGRRR